MFYLFAIYSLTSPAVGIGYVEEAYTRLQGHLYDLPLGSTQVNATLDETNSTFPPNQTLYSDFSHRTNIMSVVATFRLGQFNQSLPTSWVPCQPVAYCVSYGAPRSQHGVRNHQDTSTPQSNLSCHLNHGEDVGILHQRLPYHLRSPSPQPVDCSAG
jgi:hypothetical protein